MDTDRNLLFGLLALQADLIDTTQLMEAYTAWVAHKDTPLADILTERGWITTDDKADMRRVLERKLKKQNQDPRATLIAVLSADLRLSLAALDMPEITKTIDSLREDGPDACLPIPAVPLRRERYTLTRLHATGGIGRVWVARDEQVGRDVALKELRAEGVGQSHRARFVREARITGQLEHPSIVPVYELSRRPESQQPFYTMRLVQGRTLSTAAAAFHHRRHTGKASALDLRELLNAFVAICQAVAYAHSRGVIHRDLKGDNVLLGDFGEALVLDWGLAKVRTQDNGDPSRRPVTVNQHDDTLQPTLEGQVLGTPAFMPPEQAAGRGDQVDERADVYGLGAILYEVLTGQPPFAAATVQEVLRKVQREEPPRPRELWTSVPPALEAVCLRALAKMPADRYASARDLAQEVQRWLADEPVEAYPEPWTARVARWGRRHRPIMTAALALLVTALVGLVAGNFLIGEQKARAESNAREATKQQGRAERHLHRAQDAVYRYHTQVSEEVLLKEPGLQPLRKKLLETALQFYQGFVEEEAGNPAVQAERGRAYYRLALLNTDIGTQPHAIELFQQARTIFEELSEGYPDVLSYRKNLGESYQSLGLCYMATAQTDLAEGTFQKVIEIFRPLADAPSSADCQTDPREEVRGPAEWDPDMRRAAQRRLAMGYNNLGVLCRNTRRLPEAERFFQAGLDVRLELNAAPPKVPAYQRDLAESYNNLGSLYLETKRFAPAEAALQKALDIREELAQGDAANQEYQKLRARTIYNLGIVYLEMQQLNSAERAFTQSREILQRLADENPTVSAFQFSLAASLINSGGFYHRISRRADAEQSYRKAIALLEKLTAVHRTNIDFAVALGSTYGNIGLLILESGSPEAAQEWLDRSVSKLADVLREDERSTSARQALRNAYWWRAEALNGLEQHEQALTDWSMALDLDDGSSRNELRLQRARTLARLKEHASALAEADAVVGRKDADAITFCRAARVYAVSAGNSDEANVADHYGTRAVVLLRQAVDLGFKDLAAIQNEKDFAALRSRKDFQGLLTELEGKLNKAPD